MADNIEGQEPVVGPPAPTLAPEVREQMEMRLNGGTPPKAEEAPAAVTETVAAPAPIVDAFGILKEKFGYNTAEDALAEIENLRQLKNQPIADADFENEDSLKLFRALQAGKEGEVYNYLAQKTQIESLLSKEITKETAADYVKLGMQLKYKDLTADEISYKFNKQFAVPPKPAQSPDEEPDVYQKRVDDWQQLASDRQMEMLIEAKLAKPEVEGSKKKLVFPEISGDEGYAAYQKMVAEEPTRQAEQAKMDAEIAKAYRAFTPKSIETKIAFNDEANKIAFEFQYEPDAEGLSKATEMASDINKFWEHFYDQEGNPDRKKFLDFIYSGLNKEKIAMEAMKQSKNATIKAGLPDNSSGGLVRQLPQSQEISDLDKQMAARGIRR